MEYDYAAIGRLLKKRRLELNRKLDEISEEVKIAERYLAAIEEGRVDELPSVVYFNLFARSYAIELDIDPEQMLEDSIMPVEGSEANNQAGSRRDLLSEKKMPPQRAMFPRRMVIWLGAIVIVVIAIVVLISLSGDGNNVLKRFREVDESEDVPAAETSNAEEISADTVASIREVVPPMTLDISITETSWILVMADGDTVLNRNLEEGATRSLKADTAFLISIGNPGGVRLKLDDTLLRSLSPTGRPVRDLEINRTNRREFYSTPEEESIGGY